MITRVSLDMHRGGAFLSSRCVISLHSDPSPQIKGEQRGHFRVLQPEQPRSWLRGAPGYSVGMTAWQYAQLRVSYSNRLAADNGRRTIAWHGPDETTHDTAGAYDGVVAELNRAGTEGWELVNVATLDAGDGGRVPDQGDWSLTQYTFRRPYASAPVKNTGLVRQTESPSWQPIGTSQPADSQDGGLARSGRRSRPRWSSSPSSANRIASRGRMPVACRSSAR